MAKHDLCVCVVADKKYVGYIPLFIYCLKKAYPDYVIKILFRGTIPDDIREFCGGALITEVSLESYPNNKATMSSIRFLLGRAWFANFRFGYFTDIDILVRREKKSLLDQHVEVIEKSGLPYENLSIKHPAGHRMPGVHFVDVKRWFPAVRNAVRAERILLKQPKAALEWYYDELMLHRIVESSGVGLPPSWVKPSESWRWHGLHLGSYRRKPQGRLKTLHARDKDLIKALLRDSQFNKRLEISQKYTPEISKTIQYIREIAKI